MPRFSITAKRFRAFRVVRIWEALPVFGLFFAATAFAFLLTPAKAFSETGMTFLQDEAADAPWHIKADSIEYDHESEQYIAEGSIVVSKGDKRISADFVRFDQKHMKLFAEGHVRLSSGEDTLTGTRMEIDLHDETGIIHDADIFLKESNFYIKGHRIEKVGKSAYKAYKATVSSCDGTPPAWKITGRDLDISVEGYGFVKHAALWAKDIPVMYTPFFVFPIKFTRQTGLLLPEMGHSVRKGIEYNQPFFWAISDSSDATFYLNHMEKRGTKSGLEYRYVSDSLSKGALMLDFFEDRKSDDGTPGRSEKWGYTDDTAPRPNKDRHWFRMKHDQSLPGGFLAKLDLDLVSDQDYLHEFKDGHNGFERTEAYFHRAFGRELDDYNDPIRVSRLNLNKVWDHYSLNAEARWYDNVVARRLEDRDETLHKLPSVRLDSLRHRIPLTPLCWELNSEYTYYYRKDGAKGHRAEIHPRVSLPRRLGNYVYFEPSAGFRETLWYTDIYEEDTLPERDRISDRGTYDVRLALHSNLFRVFSPGGKIAERIRHSIKPEIIYEYVPHQEQDTHPFFEIRDRVEKKNLITYAVTNTLTGKSGGEHRQLCRVRLEQRYDIAEANEDNPSAWKNGKERQPFSPLYGEIELAPLSFASLEADAEWSVYENDLESRNVALNLWDGRGDRMFVEHRYTKDSSESLYTDVFVQISDRLSLYADYELNMRDSKEIRNSLGFSYKAPCWSADFRHTNEADDRKYAFVLNLHGLGGIGGGK